MFKALKRRWKATGADFYQYWSRYGRWSGLLTSPFFVAALILTAVCGPFWWSSTWWNLTISLIPAVLGFSVAAFALLMSIGDDSFKLKFGQVRTGNKQSALGSVSTAFFHSIVIQILALGFALVGGARVVSSLLGVAPWLMQYDVVAFFLLVAAKLFRALGFFLVAYALTSSLAAAMTIYRLSSIYSTHATRVLAQKAAKDGAAESGSSSRSTKNCS
ncbi:hypothetical protein [Stenotrophomonas sp. ATCM1_4]|uniref:hypothetical protein n=1 Tax=Stenotrophomonas sp. ATCM1_4 TaxID=2259330 RepID=UPI00104A4EF9|nr:hypothetical protein [Stenotrophomonas sp. ATCM1_4]